jgi:hypothetical protein
MGKNKYSGDPLKPFQNIFDFFLFYWRAIKKNLSAIIGDFDVK